MPYNTTSFYFLRFVNFCVSKRVLDVYVNTRDALRKNDEIRSFYDTSMLYNESHQNHKQLYLPKSKSLFHNQHSYVNHTPRQSIGLLFKVDHGSYELYTL